MLPLYGLRVVADEYYWLSDLLRNGLMLIAAILVGWPVIELIWWAYKVVFKPES